MNEAEKFRQHFVTPKQNRSTDRRQLTQRRRRTKISGLESLSKVFLYLNLLSSFTLFVRAESDLDEDADFEPPANLNNVDGPSPTDDIVVSSLHQSKCRTSLPMTSRAWFRCKSPQASPNR